MRGCLLLVVLAACSAGSAPSTSTSGSVASSGAGGVHTSASGIGGTGGQGGASSSSSSSTSSSGSGGGPDGGAPVECAKLNPGFVCVRDNDCPPMTKEELDACGPWKCVFLVEPDPDAGIPGKKGCMLGK